MDTSAAQRVAVQQARPTTWLYSTKGIAVRLFVTCWLIYSVHLATNTVREIFLALAIADHFSFQVNEYANMHADLFEKKGFGWHIGANPGASMIAAVPYALCRPAVDRIVQIVNRQRSGHAPPVYNSPWPMAREFFQEAWRRGLDVKFGLAAFIMQTLCMAPVSALGVVTMFLVLRQIFLSDRTALWLSLLYAFGTPVFFRTGYLNHNMMLGHVVFFGFLALWNPGSTLAWSERTRYLVAGVTGGAALLFDYSGLVLLLTLFGYALFRKRSEPLSEVARAGLWYVLGTIGPVALLLFYQWQSFGHPLYPGQHWMPPVEWIDVGYQGFTLPQPDLLRSLLFDYRYGLAVSSPLLMLAIAAPFVNRSKLKVSATEMWFLLGSALALWLFCGGISYTRLQFNAGIRYMAPVFPLLFVPASLALMRLPRRIIFLTAVVSIAQAWSMAMYRDVERGLGVLDPILQVFLGGFKLPVLTVLSRMTQFQDYFTTGVSPLPLFVFAAALVYCVWSPRMERSGNRTRVVDVDESTT